MNIYVKLICINLLTPSGPSVVVSTPIGSMNHIKKSPRPPRGGHSHWQGEKITYIIVIQ